MLAYGNPKFWRMFSGWFGTTKSGQVPPGNFEGVSVQGTQVTAPGWAIDPDTTESSAAYIYFGTQGKAVIAQGNRPDVATASESRQPKASPQSQHSPPAPTSSAPTPSMTAPEETNPPDA